MGGTRPFEIVLGGVVLLVMFLGWYARKHPEIAWLRGFDPRGRLTEDQRKRLKRTSDMNASLQLILLGVVLPLGYFFLTRRDRCRANHASLSIADPHSPVRDVCQAINTRKLTIVQIAKFVPIPTTNGHFAISIPDVSGGHEDKATIFPGIASQRIP
jgi:hypothetical protein